MPVLQSTHIETTDCSSAFPPDGAALADCVERRPARPGYQRALARDAELDAWSASAACAAARRAIGTRNGEQET
jgi:hypothetical protein